MELQVYEIRFYMFKKLIKWKVLLHIGDLLLGRNKAFAICH